MGQDAHPYSTLEYARTLEHVGEPRFVSKWGTYVLARSYDDRHEDVIGTYPLAMLDPGADVRGGIDQLRQDGFVSAVLICDHLFGPPAATLAAAFAVADSFKQHYVVDQSIESWAPSKHHQDEIRRARKRGITVEWTTLGEILDDWVMLYAELKARRGLPGWRISEGRRSSASRNVAACARRSRLWTDVSLAVTFGSGTRDACGATLPRPTKPAAKPVRPMRSMISRFGSPKPRR